jgi:D-alanyl-D-alanine endopeptidase (penicillin-binding protein 7)
MRKLIVITLLVSSFVYFTPLDNVAQAQEEQEPETFLNQTFSASVGEAGLTKDISLNVFEGELQVGIPAGRFSKPTILTLIKTSETTIPPIGLTLAGSIYQIDIPAEAFSAGKYYISLKSSGSNFYKQIYFFDKNTEAWRPLETNENFNKGLISSTVTFPFLRIAVFENPKKLVKGDASWYRYKNGLFAASPDFPIGTKLRVMNISNKKVVDVTVNDFGPDRAKHPTRAVDLDAVAFARLAPLSQGTMQVSVEKIFDTVSVPAPISKPVVSTGAMTIESKGALVLNSLDKKVLWSKAENTQMPLASLTKLVAIKTFLDTKPDLKKVVAYSVADEKKNNLYVLPSESARLKLLDKDQVTIKDLVYSSLIGSTNNTVETLVRVSGLTREKFIKKMNEKVVAWGAKKTHFIEPTGLSPQNITTPSDYAIIARQVFLDRLITEATTLPSYSVKTINTKRTHSFKNTNTLARDENSPILGSKTGYLVEAGYCLATKWPTSKDKNIIVVLFGAPNRNATVEDTKKLIAYAEQNIK